MGEFRHVATHIHIDELYLPLSFFMTQEPLYNLPSPYIRRNYIQPGFHMLSDGSTEIGGSLPYTDGDSYIAKKALYEAAYYDFLNPEPTLEEAKIIRISETAAYSDNIKKGKVVFNGDVYLSVNIFMDRIKGEFQRYKRAGSIPGGYYVNEENDDQIPFTLLNDLSNLIDKILLLWYLCDVNEDFHRANINALVTVPAVQSYDFTTGWVLVPYN